MANTSDLREAGHPAGYKDATAYYWDRFPVPPIFLVTTVTGPTLHRPHPEHPDPNMRSGPEGYYKVIGHGTRKYKLDYGQIGKEVLELGRYRLSEMYRSGTVGELNPSVSAHDDFLARFMYCLVPFEKWSPAYINHYDNAPHIQRVIWSIEEEQLQQWANMAGIEDIDDFLTEATVRVYVLSNPSEPLDPQGNFLPLTKGEEDQLMWHSVMGTITGGFEEGQRYFNLDILGEKSFPEDNPVLKEWETIGAGYAEWGPVHVRRDGCSALSYEVRVLHDDKILAAFPVDFGKRSSNSQISESAGGKIIETAIAGFREPDDIEGTYSGYLVIEQADRIREFVIDLFTPFGMMTARIFGSELDREEIREIIDSAIVEEDIGERIDFTITIEARGDGSYIVSSVTDGTEDIAEYTAPATYENGILTFDLGYEDGSTFKMEGSFTSDRQLSGSLSIDAWGFIRNAATGRWSVEKVERVARHSR